MAMTDSSAVSTSENAQLSQSSGIQGISEEIQKAGISGETPSSGNAQQHQDVPEKTAALTQPLSVQTDRITEKTSCAGEAASAPSESFGGSEAEAAAVGGAASDSAKMLSTEDLTPAKSSDAPEINSSDFSSEAIASASGGLLSTKGGAPEAQPDVCPMGQKGQKRVCPERAVRDFRGLMIAFLLALLTSAALLAPERSVGFVRDEGIYFESGRRYAAWYLDDIPKHGTGAFADSVISRRFSTNREHPALMKSLFGLSERIFTEKLKLVREATGFRLPAIFLSGLFSALIFLFGRRVTSLRGAIFAAVSFWVIPRTFFHGVLSCFDMPIAFAWFLTAACYWRASAKDGIPCSLRWSLATGLSFGLALSIKHNAWIIPGVLFIHWMISSLPQVLRTSGARGIPRSLLPFASMLAIGPAVLFVTWPYLWHHPIERFLWYANFHTNHINYPWEFFGTLLTEAPFPVGYAPAVSAVTVPAAIFVLMCTGSLWEMARFAKTYVFDPLKRRLTSSKSGQGENAALPAASGDTCASDALQPLDGLTLLLLGNGFASLFVFSMPFIPIFGGVKHWLPAMPFLCLFAARALERIACAAEEAGKSLIGRFPAAADAKTSVHSERKEKPAADWRVFTLLAALAILPAVAGLVRIHPYGTSFYNELAGGLPGAASLGMHRQYWSNNVTGVLNWINKNAPKQSRIYLHEVTQRAFEDYKRNGMLRKDLRRAGGFGDADLAANKYMPEFRDTEFQIWNNFGSLKPAAGLYLDETPQIVVYQRKK